MPNKCSLIAEAGWNFLGDLFIAEQMIESAAEAGADYVKFQTWSTSRLKSGPWDDDGRREIYEKAELSKDDHYKLKEMCEKNSVKFLTSCFCKEDLDFIRTLTNEVKIASTECNNIELVEDAISKFDHVYISTGTALEKEYLHWAKFDNVTLLHCVSAYPCSADLVNLPKLVFLKNKAKRFGYSGHYQGIWDAVAAITLGASIVEKHFTIDNSLPGRDNKFALLPFEFNKIRQYVDSLADMMIDHGFGYQECEKEAREVYSGRWG